MSGFGVSQEEKVKRHLLQRQPLEQHFNKLGKDLLRAKVQLN
jgi:hypothetical protein